MNILAVILIMLVITAADMLPLLKKKQGKEAVTMAYGYYYSTHEYSASLVKLLFDLLNMR
jgi:hypothetical protein